MFRKYFCLGVLLLCICFCINGVAATDNVTYDNGNYLGDSNQVISESVVNKSDNQDEMAESDNNDSVSNKDSDGVSNFNKHNFMSIQSSNYYGNVFNENTGIYYDDLQQAIFSAWEGNKLIVYGGYYENIILSRNDLTITCVNQYNSTIGNLYVHFVSGCNISGFTINSMDLYNAYENIFCNNFFDYYEKFNNWPTSNPVIMISNSYYNLFESNRIKQNTNGLFILAGDSYSTFRFNFFDKIDYYPYGDIDVSSSYLDLDNNLWYWMEMESYSSGYFQSIKNELIRNQGSYVILDKWIVPKFNIVNYKPVLDFNFNNFNEDISPLGSMNKINILYQMYWDYNIMISEIKNGYAELNLPYNTNSFYLLIDYYIPIMLFEDESFIFNKNTSNYYKNLQEAIDDIYTLNGHTLELYGSHSIGNIFLHKNLTINGLGLTINNLLTNNDGSGSKISNFIIKNLSIVNFNDLNFLNFAFDNLNIIDSNDLNFSNFVIENLKIINSTNLTFSNNQFRNVFVNNSNYVNFTSNVIGSYFEVFNSDNLVFLRNQIYNLLVETSHSSMFSGNTFCGRLINLVDSSLFNNTIDGLTIYNSQIMDIISNNFSSNTYIEYSSDIVLSGNNFANIVFLGSSCIFNSNNISGNIQDSRSSVTGSGVWWRNVYNRMSESYYSSLQKAIDFSTPGHILEVYGGYYENIILNLRHVVTIIGLNESRINNLTIKNSNLCNISGFKIWSIELYNSHENTFNSNYFGGDYYDFSINRPLISIFGCHNNYFISNKIKQNSNELLVYSQYSSSIFRFNSFERSWDWSFVKPDIEAIDSQIDLDNNLWYDIQNLVNDPYNYWRFIDYRNILINNQNSEIIFDKMIIPRISLINNKLFVDFNYNNFGEDISYLGCMDKIELYVDYPSSLIYPIVEVVNGYIELKPNLFSSGFDVLFESFYISVNRFVFNHNTSKYYNILQEAIDDVSTLNGHVIDVVNSYIGNTVLYKNLTLNSNGGSVNNFLVNNSGSGSRISGFNIQNLRLIDSSDLKVLNNQINNLFVINSSFNSFISNNLKDNAEIIDSDGLNFSNNQIFSILFNNSNNNQILSNKINNYLGLNNSQDNVVSNNTVLNLFIENSNNFSLISNNISNNLTVLYSNNITFVSNNLGNISSNNSFVNCSFNSIKGKINNFNGTVIANNNWWGTNNVTINDIMVTGSNPVVCDSWLVVNDQVVNGTLVLDFTYNNLGENVYNYGCIPENISVVINNGTHDIATLYTNKGKVYYTLPNYFTNLTVYVGEWSKKIRGILNYSNFNSNLVDGRYNESQNLTLKSNNDSLTIKYSINYGDFISGGTQVDLNLANGYYFIQYKGIDNFGSETNLKTLFVIIGNPSLPGNVVNFDTGRFYNSIQAAIDDSETLDGHYIEVLDGVYTENIVINKSISLVAVNIHKTTIVPLDIGLPTILLNKSGIVINGFNLANNSRSTGIFINDVSNCTILHNNFTNNRYHITNKGTNLSHCNWIVNNVFNKLNDDFSGEGISISNAEDYLIYDNIFPDPLGYYHPYSGYIAYRFAGIDLYNVNNFSIYNNYFEGNYDVATQFNRIHYCEGIEIFNSSNVIIQNNKFINLCIGIYTTNDYNISIKENLFKNNFGGIYSSHIELYNNSGFINFNSFINNRYDVGISKGMYNLNNNWWGSNDIPYITNIYLEENTDIWFSNDSHIDFDHWIVASIFPSSYKVVDGRIYETTVTIDMTHNSRNEDVSPIGCIPDGSIVKFYPEGILMATSVITNGKASYTMSLDTTSTNNYTEIYAQVDEDIIYNFVSNIASTEIIIYSSAIDIATGNNLNFTYQLPVNGSVSWFSIFWNQTDLFTADVNLVYNGRIVLTKHVINTAYNLTKNYYQENVFKAIRDLNFEIGSNLNVLNSLDSTLFQNLIMGQIDIVANRYNLTFDEKNFVINYSIYFVDTINVLVYYFGDDRLNFPLSDYDSLNNNIIDLPGNPSIRSSLIFYKNNIYNGHDTGFEGMKSYAIASSNVTNNDLSYWVSKNSTFSAGAMKAAYGTFLTALLVIYEHDRIADQSAKEFNVTWNRTTPVMISLNNDVTSVYITGESNHRMGMDVYGNESNIYSFRMACSFAFSLVEELVANNTYGTGEIGTVNLGIFKDVAEGAKLVSYYSNGYLVVYAEGNNNSVMYIDLANGIVRDSINGTILGAPCYHYIITDIVVKYAQNLLDSNSTACRMLGLIGNISFSFSIGNMSSFYSNLAEIFKLFGYEDIVEFYTDNEFYIRLGADVAGGFIIEGGIVIFSANPLIGGIVIVGGVSLVFYGSELDKEPLNLYNWLNFGTSIILSLTPETNVMKIAVKLGKKKSSEALFALLIIAYNYALVRTGESIGQDKFFDILERIFGKQNININIRV
nr:right-handed parallel beta-helix repeat-containing protein [Methanobrevibacter arboriphilus]